MAQRANKFARRQAADPAPAEQAQTHSPAADDAPTEIPLDLAAIIAPHRRRGRLSLRVERIPFQGRLSKGRNNGDRSWSLAPDELDDVRYLPPKGMTEPHTLAVRIVSLDGGDGATLALVDYPVLSPKESSAVETRATAKSDPAELRRLRDELSELQSALDLRDAELAEARMEAEQLRAQEGFNDRKVVEARAAWDVELKERLAEVARRAASDLENSRRLWAAERATGPSSSEAELQERHAAERARWQDEMQARLAAAESNWKDEEAARRSALEAEWQKRLGQARADAVAARVDDTELRRLRDELAQTRIALVARESELAEAQSTHDAARLRWLQESDDAAARLEARCKADAQSELSAVQAIWREKAAQDLARSEERLKQTETTLAEIRADRDASRAESARLRAESTDAGGVRGELMAAQAALAARDEELTKVKSALEQREHELATARWASEEANKRVEAHKTFDAELRTAREHLAAAQAALAIRESELLEERSAANQVRRRAQQDIEAALAKAKSVWKGDEAARIAAAEAKGREENAQVLADLTVRFNQSEAALTDARAQLEARRSKGEDREVLRLRDELAAMQVAMAEHERDATEARFAVEQASHRYEAPIVTIDKPQDWRAEEAQAEARERRVQFARRLIRDVALAGAVAGLLVIAYVKFGTTVSDQVWPRIEPLTTGMEPILRQVGLSSGSPRIAPVTAPAAPVTHSVIGVRAANIRSGPSTANPVVATLSRDREVAVLERRGDWVLARFDGADGKNQQGWVFGSFLKDVPPGGSKAAAATPSSPPKVVSPKTPRPAR
jgi:hypothetical protein